MCSADISCSHYRQIRRIEQQAINVITLHDRERNPPLVTWAANSTFSAITMGLLGSFIELRKDRKVTIFIQIRL